MLALPKSLSLAAALALCGCMLKPPAKITNTPPRKTYTRPVPTVILHTPLSTPFPLLKLPDAEIAKDTPSL